MYAAYLITAGIIIIILAVIIGTDLESQMTVMKWGATFILILLLGFIWFVPYKDTKSNRQIVKKYYHMQKRQR